MRSSAFSRSTDRTARLLAGGTDLLVRLRLGHIRPAVVVDLKRVGGLRADVIEADDALRIGARAVMTDLIADPRIQRDFPALVEAASVVGRVQIRNRATLAGNICNASPAADTAPALLALRRDRESRQRRRPAARRRSRTSSSGRVGRCSAGGELVESIDLPRPVGPTGAAFGRVTRRRGVDLATINLCCLVTRGRARFAFGAVGPRPFVVDDASGVLRDPGRAAAPDAQDAALARLISYASPISDVRGGPRLSRRDARRSMSRAALQRAIGRLRGPGRKRARMSHAAVSDRARRSTAARTSLEVAGTTRCSMSFAIRPGLTGTKECCAERRVRRVHRALQRPRGLVVPHARRRSRRRRRHHDRRPGGRRTARPLQQAFVANGAVQCGFCIPGMIMSAKYLLMTNPAADRGGDPGRARRQSVPVRRIQPHHRRRGARPRTRR